MKIFINQISLLVFLLFFALQLNASSQLGLGCFQYSGIVYDGSDNSEEWSGLATGPTGLIGISQYGAGSLISKTDGSILIEEIFDTGVYKDYEAITYLFTEGSIEYYAALAENYNNENGLSTIYILEFNGATFDFANIEFTIPIAELDAAPPLSENYNLEALTYDPINKYLYLANEKDPRKLYSISFDATNLASLSSIPSVLNANEVDLSSILFDPDPSISLLNDFAGLHHLAQDPSSVGTDYENNILLLTQHCQTVYEIELTEVSPNNITASFVESFDLKNAVSGNPSDCLDNDNAFKPEGIAFADGQIYIVCDDVGPPITYIFDKPFEFTSFNVTPDYTFADVQVGDCYGIYEWSIASINNPTIVLQSGTESLSNFSIYGLESCSGYILSITINGVTIDQQFNTNGYNIPMIVETEWITENSIGLSYESNPYISEFNFVVTNLGSALPNAPAQTPFVVCDIVSPSLSLIGGLEPCTNYQVQVSQGDYLCVQTFYNFTTPGCPECDAGTAYTFNEFGNFGSVTWDIMVGASYEVYYTDVPSDDCTLTPMPSSCQVYSPPYQIVTFNDLCNIQRTVWVNYLCSNGEEDFSDPIQLGVVCKQHEIPEVFTQYINNPLIIELLEYSLGNPPEVVELIVSMPNGENEIYLEFINQVGEEFDITALLELANFNENIEELLSFLTLIENELVKDPRNEELQETLMAIQIQLVVEVMLSNYKEERPRRLAINDFEIYPNPAKNQVQLTAENNQNILNVKIFDVLGKEVNSIQPNSNSTSLDVSRLSNGIYFIEIETIIAKHTKKLIVE